MKSGRLTGFGNHFESEAIPDVLPIGQNSPQHVAYGLYAEQLSGSAFTAPRSTNQRSWLYRLRPSVCHTPFVPIKLKVLDFFNLFEGAESTPEQLRWSPPSPQETARETDWLDGLRPIACAGDVSSRDGLAIYMYSFRSPMSNRAFYSSDGDFLVVPQCGGLLVTTEFGVLEVRPREICVVQRGIRFSIDPILIETRDDSVGERSKESGGRENMFTGYALEVYSGHFELPDLGPIGANCLANPQDFEYPSAHFIRESESSDNSSAEKTAWRVVNKFDNRLFECTLTGGGTPFNVVAWRGNYVPFKYNMDRFVALGSVTRDHPDPSIFTVLTCKSNTPGTAIADFVIFPERWQVAEGTFRPPYFHRNVMSEFMGMICGRYEAKIDDGFVPGGASLHPNCSAHGPDLGSYLAAINEPNPQIPTRIGIGSLAFMFETSLVLRVTPWARSRVQSDYNKVWESLPSAKI